MVSRLQPVIIGALALLVLQCSSPKTMEPKEKWSVKTAQSFIKEFPNPDSIHWRDNNNHFSWQAGYMMFTMEKMWKLTGDSTYYNYISKYVDQQVDSAGNIPDFKPDALDNFIPGYAILFMYEQTQREKYKIAAGKIFEAFATYPRNSDSSFWHGSWCPNQMWVDGVFMGQIFMARYGKTIGSSDTAFNEVARQMKLIVQHCKKPNGLLLHGWDESRKADWADKNSGLASEVWSEGLGWYAVLIADVLDYMPKTHPDYAFIQNHLTELCNGLKSCQHKETGMWCQVVDKPEAEGNWDETSGTGMFMYLIKRSVQKGLISKEEFEPVLQKAYNSIITKAKVGADNFVDIVQCSSIGIQKDYKTYIEQPKEVNTFAGISSFILGTSVMELEKK
jgi:rhamnogalacturonyl hydrolase YesR